MTEETDEAIRHQRYQRVLIWNCGHSVEDLDDTICLRCGFPEYDNWKEKQPNERT